MAVPQRSCQSAEEEVVCPQLTLLVVAKALVLCVLIEAVDCVCNKTSQGYEQSSRQALEHRVCEVAKVDILAKLQAYVETAAHHTCQQSDSQALREVEVLNRSLLLLLRQRLSLHHACNADNSDTNEGHHHAGNNSESERRELIQLREEDIEQHRTQHGTTSCASAESDALAECHAEVAHRKAECQATNTPQHSKEDSHKDVEAILGREELEEAVSCGHSQQRA